MSVEILQWIKLRFGSCLVGGTCQELYTIVMPRRELRGDKDLFR